MYYERTRSFWHVRALVLFPLLALYYINVVAQSELLACLLVRNLSVCLSVCLTPRLLFPIHFFLLTDRRVRPGGGLVRGVQVMVDTMDNIRTLFFVHEAMGFIAEINPIASKNQQQQHCICLP